MNINSDSTTVTVSEVYKDFKGALESAADALKTSAEHVYLTLVRQQMINSVSIVIAYAGLLLATYVSWRIVTSYVNKKEQSEKDLEYYQVDYSLLYIIPSLLGVVSVILFLVTISKVITGFINPEYGAIQEIREFIK